MVINKYDKAKLTKHISEQLLKSKFTFAGLEITGGADGKLILKFEDASHPLYKNVRLLSHLSSIRDTTLFTVAYMNLRFLHGNYKSPKVGFKIISFKVTLS